MSTGREPLADIAFTAPVIQWRGPAPYYFVAVPDEQVGEVRHAARLASYGWGCVPVEAVVGAITFRTSLFPKDGGYLLPLRAAVRKESRIALGDIVAVRMLINDRFA
jgi:hypothetical protein